MEYSHPSQRIHYPSSNGPAASDSVNSRNSRVPLRESNGNSQQQHTSIYSNPSKLASHHNYLHGRSNAEFCVLCSSSGHSADNCPEAASSFARSNSHRHHPRILTPPVLPSQATRIYSQDTPFIKSESYKHSFDLPRSQYQGYHLAPLNQRSRGPYGKKGSHRKGNNEAINPIYNTQQFCDYREKQTQKDSKELQVWPDVLEDAFLDGKPLNLLIPRRRIWAHYIAL